MISEDLKNKLESLTWFHSIDFGGGYVSNGTRFRPDAPPNATLYPLYHFLRHIDLSGMECLDVGTADGLVAFTMKKMGAKKVVAVDGTTYETFETAREILDIELEYNSDIEAQQLDEKLPRHSYDLIFAESFINHLFAPLTALMAFRNLLKPKGLLILETIYAPSEEPVLFLNTEYEEPISPNQSTYFVGSKRGLEGMLKLSGFEIKAICTMGNAVKRGRGRITFLAQAVRPSEISSRTAQLVKTQTNISEQANISFKALENPTVTESQIQYTGRNEEIRIVAERFDASDFPLQPTVQ